MSYIPVMNIDHYQTSQLIEDRFYVLDEGDGRKMRESIAHPDSKEDYKPLLTT